MGRQILEPKMEKESKAKRSARLSSKNKEINEKILADVENLSNRRATTSGVMKTEPKTKKLLSTQHVYKHPDDVQRKYPYIKPYKMETVDEEGTSERIDDREEDKRDYPYGDEEKMEEDEEEEKMEEGEDSDNEEYGRTSFDMNGDGFSISQHLSNERKNPSSIDRIRDAVDRGSALDIGFSIRDGFANNTLTDLQIEELCNTLQRPNISLMQHYNESEYPSADEKRSIDMGHMFLLKMAMAESKAVNKLRASVNSLASSFSSQNKVSLLTKRTLDNNHVIEPIENFPQMDLVHQYNRHNLVGDSAFSQMTFFLTKVFKTVLNPPYAIWYYTYRPKCMRPTDRHFKLFPEQIAEKLIDFAYDVIGVNLPDHLLHGDFELTDPFLVKMNWSDPVKEVQKRRNDRQMVSQTMQSSIGQMLNYARDYHYCIETNVLDSCKLRSNCTAHLTWKSVKQYREHCRKNHIDTENFSPQKVQRFSNSNGKDSA